MIHELWDDPNDEGRWLFCLAGLHGEAARSHLGPNARVVWTVEASSHIEAMTLYWAHQGWGVYTSDLPHVVYSELGWE